MKILVGPAPGKKKIRGEAGAGIGGNCHPGRARKIKARAAKVVELRPTRLRCGPISLGVCLGEERGKEKGGGIGTSGTNSERSFFTHLVRVMEGSAAKKEEARKRGYRGAHKEKKKFRA